MNGMLLDDVLPAWDFRSGHSIVVAAPAARVAQALESFSLLRDGSSVVRLLFRARGLSFPSAPTLRTAVTSAGFSVLAERPGREIVFGIAGKFWAPREMANLISVPDSAAFRAFARPGHAKGALAIAIRPLTDERTLLRTETRVACVDRRARLLFGVYWTLIRVPSGWIRRDMLRAIARRAVRTERHATAEAAR